MPPLASSSFLLFPLCSLPCPSLPCSMGRRRGRLRQSPPLIGRASLEDFPYPRCNSLLSIGHSLCFLPSTQYRAPP
ncbi:hypothetical protein GQ53DRAFT_755130 [Thozetella sp. PMI_491]|nr:hypothetical protein GQ53DRAFT_755130 [Thozetella sp. PMI_491]